MKTAILLAALALTLTACTTTVAPDGTKVSSLDPGVSAALASGAVIITGAAAKRNAADIASGK